MIQLWKSRIKVYSKNYDCQDFFNRRDEVYNYNTMKMSRRITSIFEYGYIKSIKTIKKSKSNYFSGELNNIVFLDFDGVLNLDINNYTGNFKAKEPIANLNRFCLENEFKIVVVSSWRKRLNYKEILFEAGLDKKIDILGATDILEKDRESEVIDYVEKHQNTNKFIILDDGKFNELSRFKVKTDFNKGFNAEKYEEAINLINKTDWRLK